MAVKTGEGRDTFPSLELYATDEHEAALAGLLETMRSGYKVHRTMCEVIVYRSGQSATWRRIRIRMEPLP